MPATPLTFTIDDDSELGRALNAHPHLLFTLLKGRRHYQVINDPDDIWANYDPERVRVALEKAAGILTPDEDDRLQEAICRAREEGTRPPDRP